MLYIFLRLNCVTADASGYLVRGFCDDGTFVSANEAHRHCMICQSQGRSEFGHSFLVSENASCGLSRAGFAEYGGMSSRYDSGKF